MLFDLINDGLLKRLKRQNRRFRKVNEISKNRKSNLKIQKREIAALRKKVTSLENEYVVEWCKNCHTQNTILWNVKEQGLTAFCPVCGQKMMLCSYCHGDCDYDYGIEVCKEM